MNLRRLGAALLLTGLALAGTATPASAHAELLGSDPATGVLLSEAPKQIVLTFSEAVGLPANPISVTGPDGSTWKIGQVTAAGPVITVPVEATGPAGEYVVDYKVISADGDEIGDKLRFALATAATPSTTSAAPTTTTTTAPTTTSASAAPSASSAPADDDGGIPLVAWILGAVVLAGAGAFAGLRLGKSKAG